MNRRNVILAAVALGAAGGLVAWALRPAPIAVETAEATRGPFEQALVEDGKTRVRDRYTVSAPLAGRVARSQLRVGDRVARGAEVAALSPVVPALLDERTSRERLGAAEAQHARARAEKARWQAQRDQARADLERQVKLASGGFVAPAAREAAELQARTVERGLESATFAEDAAQHELALARAALARYGAGAGAGPAAASWRVTSPVDGSVLRLHQESEGVVPLGAPLVEIADPRGLEAVVDVLSQDSVQVHPGMAARLEIGGGAPALRARVRLVEPAAFTKVSALGVEEQRVNVVLDFVDSLEAVRTIGDGFRVEARIVVFRAEDALRVPVGALFRDAGGWAAYVVVDGRAHRREVKVTHRNGVEALVEAGLQPGERVVVYPSDLLKDGARVAPRFTR